MITEKHVRIAIFKEVRKLYVVYYGVENTNRCEKTVFHTTRVVENIVLYEEEIIGIRSGSEVMPAAYEPRQVWKRTGVNLF